jgi:hypothetical protein
MVVFKVRLASPLLHICILIGVRLGIIFSPARYMFAFGFVVSSRAYIHTYIAFVPFRFSGDFCFFTSGVFDLFLLHATRHVPRSSLPLDTTCSTFIALVGLDSLHSLLSPPNLGSPPPIIDSFLHSIKSIGFQGRIFPLPCHSTAWFSWLSCHSHHHSHPQYLLCFCLHRHQKMPALCLFHYICCIPPPRRLCFSPFLFCFVYQKSEGLRVFRPIMHFLHTYGFFFPFSITRGTYDTGIHTNFHLFLSEFFFVCARFLVKTLWNFCVVDFALHFACFWGGLGMGLFCVCIEVLIDCFEARVYCMYSSKLNLHLGFLLFIIALSGARMRRGDIERLHIYKFPRKSWTTSWMK